MDLSKMTWGEMQNEVAELDAYLMKRSPKYKRAMALREEIERIKTLARDEAKKLDKENNFKDDVWTVKEFTSSVTIEGKKIIYKIGTRSVKAKEAHIQRPFTII
jgi:hypothetical protein